MNINGLVSDFLTLQDEWEAAPNSFDWNALKALATSGSQAYNEGNGPSFHLLALGGAEHTEFHLRFLEYSLAAGFDPFKLVFSDERHPAMPVFDHEGLAEVAAINEYSASMYAMLEQVKSSRT
jgi:hypothetical protein